MNGLYIIPILVVFTSLCRYGSTPLHVTKESLFVPGNGFKGYYWSLGYLDANRNSEDDYYCYSSGCFSVLSHLLHDDMRGAAMEMNVELRKELLEGSMSRFNLLGSAIDRMYDNARVEEMEEIEKKRILDRINIILTRVDLAMVIKKAETFEELKLRLLQTSWIPGITGTSIFHHFYMEGWFSYITHPTFERTAPLFPFTWGLDPRMDPDEALALYENGRLSVIE